MFVAPFALALALAAAQKQPAVAQPAVVRPALQVQPARRVAQRAAFRQKQPLQPILPIGFPPASGSGTTSPVLAAGGPGDENVLKAVKLQTTDQALLDFFRKRTPPAPAKEKLDELVKKLSSKEATDRDTAQGELTAVGQAAVPLLRQAANNID